MTDLRKAAEMALEALEDVVKWYASRDANENLMPCHNQNPEIKLSMESVEALRQALAEPVLYMDSKRMPKGTPDWKPGMVFPKPKREWVGIEPQEIGQIWANHKEVYGFGIELEQVLKERNT